MLISRERKGEKETMKSCYLISSLDFRAFLRINASSHADQSIAERLLSCFNLNQRFQQQGYLKFRHDAAYHSNSLKQFVLLILRS